MLRYLDPSEQAPALNRLTGGGSWLVLPSQAPREVRKAWQEFAQALARRYPGLRSIDDDDLPADGLQGNRLILGWDNRLFDPLAHHFNHGSQQLDRQRLQLDDRQYTREAHALVLVESLADNSSLGVVAADDATTIRALARKLGHYGSFGRMVFEKGSANNLLRDVLSPRQSVLSRQLGDQPVQLALAPETVLGERLADE